MNNERYKNEKRSFEKLYNRRDKNYNKKIDMIDEIIKADQGIKIIEYLVSWVIRGSTYFIGKNETRFSAKFEVTKEDEFKILLRCLLIEILTIEKFLQDEDTKLDILDIRKYIRRKGKNGKFLLEMKKSNLETYEIEVKDEGLTINEFNLYWKYDLISGELRGWHKKLLYKREVNEIINETCPRFNNEIEEYENFSSISRLQGSNRRFVGFCYGKYRERIWIKRCDEVAEIEKERGINSKNKRKKKKRNEDDVDRDVNRKSRKIEKTNENSLNINEKNTENSVKLATRDSLLGDDQ
ncbi:hypothetical protein C1646_820040 [Rhizophagus diaphanus]|nr:hypothetical protein C1646_820040 [Rhizophagus diaphanus] [Rhizophagus sp. MUCL 43196]